MPNHDIDRLEGNLKKLVRSFKTVFDEDDFIELIKIIRFPGWTTPAEYLLVNGVVENMQQQVKQFAHLKKTLLEGSRMVGKKG